MSESEYDEVESYLTKVDNMGCHGIRCKWFTHGGRPCDRCHELLVYMRVPHKYEEQKPEPVPDVGGVIHPEIPMHSSVYHLTITTDKDDPYEIRDALHKFVQSAQVEAVYWIAAMELTKAKLPHIHVAVYSKRKYIDVKKISKAKYFQKRFQLNQVKDLEKYLLYINKNYRCIDTEEYCARKSIPQFWSIKDGDENNIAVQEHAE